jgi:hypothetical protein
MAMGNHFVSTLRIEGNWHAYDGKERGGKTEVVSFPQKFKYLSFIVYIKTDTPVSHYAMNIPIEPYQECTTSESEFVGYTIDTANKNPSFARMEFQPQPVDCEDRISSGPPETIDLFPPMEYSASAIVIDNAVSVDQFTELLDTDSGIELAVNGMFEGNKVWLDWEMYHNVNVENLVVSHDIDSVRVNAKELPVLDDIKFFPFPNRYSTMDHDNKCCWHYHGEMIPLYQFPNMEFATSGKNSVFHIHIFFPKLRRCKNSKWVNWMTRSQYESFYDNAVHPALVYSVGADAMDKYPASYRTAESNARNSKGNFSYIARLIPHEILHKFFAQLRHIIDSGDGTIDFQEYFFHVHAKDLKLVMRSSVRDPIVALNETYKSFNWQKFDRTEFWLDIGAEFRSKRPGMTLLWSGYFVQRYLKSLGLVQLQNHPWCQSTTVAGGSGRGKPGSSVLFCQLYHGEKNLFYTYEDGGGVKAFSAMDVADNSSRFNHAMQDFEKSLNYAANNSYPVRMEWTLKYHDYTSAIDSIFASHHAILPHQPLYTIPTHQIVKYKTQYVRAISRFATTVRRWPTFQKELLSHYIVYAIKTMISAIIKVPGTKELKINSGRRTHNWAVASMVDINQPMLPIVETAALVKRLNKRVRFQRSHTVSRAVNPTCISDLHVANIHPVADAKAMIAIFVKAICKTFPAPGIHLKDNCLFLEDLSYATIMESVQRPFFTGAKASWKERFSWYFPPSKNDMDLGNGAQGWRQLEYWDTYFNWILTDTQAKREALWECFNKMDCLPAGSQNDKLWKTHSVRGHEGTFVYFVQRPSSETRDWSCPYCSKSFKKLVSGALSKAIEKHRATCMQ